MKLDELKARKAKADALGPDAIRQNQSLYDDICKQIEKLEQDNSHTGAVTDAAWLQNFAVDVLVGLDDPLVVDWLRWHADQAVEVRRARMNLMCAIRSGVVDDVQETAKRFRAVGAAIQALADGHALAVEKVEFEKVGE